MAFFRRISVAVTIASINLLPQTLCINKYRKFRARYDFDNNEIPVREDLKEKFQQVMDEIKLSETHRERIQLFNVHDLDVFHAGETWVQKGAIIGVPVNFEYDDPASITEQTVSFNIPVSKNLKANKDFRQSLVLSENAQKFAFAKSIFLVAQNNLLWKTFNIICDTSIALYAYSSVLSILKIAKEQKLQRCGIAGAVGLLCYSSCVLMNSMIEDNTELNVNKKLLALGPDYIEGGLEYYRKLSQRNKALRVLLGDMGPYKFTASGNEFFWIAKKKVTITSQIDQFSDTLRVIQPI